MTKLVLDSSISPYLVSYLANAGTHNPDSQSFIIGGWPEYIITGGENVSSYYSLPGNVYNILKGAGDEYWQAPNELFITRAWEAGKELFIDLAEGKFIGNGLDFELRILEGLGK